MIHLVVGTPCYGGMMCTEYTQSILALKEACLLNNVKLTCVFLGNESLIQRGRNTIAHVFLKMQDATHLLFIDADQKFNVKDVVRLLKADKGIIGGAVPMKGLNWDRIRQGAVLNHPNLSSLSGIFNVNKLDGHEMVDADTPFQVKHVGTGFMLIRRDVFEKLKPVVGWYHRKEMFSNEKVYDFFKVQNVNNELLSEDYNFCHMYRELGESVWLAPWCELGHFGSYLFSGQYSQPLQGNSNGTSLH